ncbi:MAG TPA: chemotaxis response regulator protein-glutamate methylesterase [Longimicrobiales bacterium]|nr:chemotaxis response regulator protein-glutamate methylesterase [Longimicrobiales bacterium]
MAQIIKVLVVDDSAFVRKVVTQMLQRSPFIEVVGTARDGTEALELAEKHTPDVVTLDLVMPGMNGVEFLKAQMARRPIPVVVCSIAHESAELAIAAFDAGAVEFVQKPTALATERVFEMAEELIEKVKAASQVEMAKVLAPVMAQVPAPARSRTATPKADVLGIGISTGGPQALRQLIPALPADFPVPILVVLHMPVGYTEMYAQRLDQACALEVVEARDGDLLRAGTVFIAPAGRHMTVVKTNDGVRVHLDLRPFDTQHRPSVDVLFRSLADCFGERTLGLVMTGMGADGVLGAAHIKGNGGHVLTEAESSCVVYGMPKAVVEAALSDRAVPLERLPETLLEMI